MRRFGVCTVAVVSLRAFVSVMFARIITECMESNIVIFYYNSWCITSYCGFLSCSIMTVYVNESKQYMCVCVCVCVCLCVCVCVSVCVCVCGGGR